MVEKSRKRWNKVESEFKSIKVSRETYEQIKVASERTEVPMGKLVARAIRQYVDKSNIIFPCKVPEGKGRGERK